MASRIASLVSSGDAKIENFKVPNCSSIVGYEVDDNLYDGCSIDFTVEWDVTDVDMIYQYGLSYSHKTNRSVDMDMEAELIARPQSGDAISLIKFVQQLSQVRGVTICQTIGSRDMGTTIQILFGNSLLLLEAIREMAEVEAVEEVPKLKGESIKRILITLKRASIMDPEPVG